MLARGTGIAPRALVNAAPLGHHSRRPNRRQRPGGDRRRSSQMPSKPLFGGSARPPQADRALPDTRRPKRTAPLDAPLDVMAWM